MVNLAWHAFVFTVFASVVSAAVSVPVRRQHSSRDDPDRHGRLAKRASPVQLRNLATYYEIVLEIGTPPQDVAFTIDTGSSDLWVMAASNPYCSSAAGNGNGPNCSSPIVFDYDRSTSFKVNDSSTFGIKYGDSTFASGYYAQDTVRVGGITSTGSTFAIALQSNSTEAVFGIGPIYGETFATNLTPNSIVGPTYLNVPAQLKQQGQIQRVAYSLWLNDPDAGDGSLLMGGVDHAKYQGTLGIVPMVDGSGQNFTYPRLPWVMLHGIAGYRGNEVGDLVELSVPILLDSGTTLVYLPKEAVDSIGNALNGSYSSTHSSYVVPCNSSLDGLLLDFSGIKLNFPLDQVLTPLVDEGPANQCVLAIGIDDYLILGDVFLRGVYAVFDNESFQVGLANALFNVTDTNVQDLTTGIPGTSAPSYSSTGFSKGVISTHRLLLSTASDALTEASSTEALTEASSTEALTEASSTEALTEASSTEVSQTSAEPTSGSGLVYDTATEPSEPASKTGTSTPATITASTLTATSMVATTSELATDASSPTKSKNIGAAFGASGFSLIAFIMLYI